MSIEYLSRVEIPAFCDSDAEFYWLLRIRIKGEREKAKEIVEKFTEKFWEAIDFIGYKQEDYFGKGNSIEVYAAIDKLSESVEEGEEPVLNYAVEQYLNRISNDSKLDIQWEMKEGYDEREINEIRCRKAVKRFVLDFLVCKSQQEFIEFIEDNKEFIDIGENSIMKISKFNYSIKYNKKIRDMGECEANLVSAEIKWIIESKEA